MKRGQGVALGQCGELKDKCLVYKVIKWCSGPVDVLPLKCSIHLV